MSEWTAEKIAALPDASPDDVQSIAKAFAALEQKADEVRWYAKRAIDAEQKCEQLERERDAWKNNAKGWRDISLKLESQVAALEGREP